MKKTLQQIRTEERARCGAIVNHGMSQGQTHMAGALAFNTEIPAPHAMAIMAGQTGFLAQVGDNGESTTRLARQIVNAGARARGDI